MRLLLVVALAACTHGGMSYCDHGMEFRDPATGICEFVDTCRTAAPDWSECQGACDGLSESQCLATSSCHATYVENGSDQGPAFWQCWDIPQSGPLEGNCAGLDASTCDHHDDCTSIYTPGASSTDTFEGCAPAIGSCVNVDCGQGDYWVVQPPATRCECVFRTTAGTCPGQPVCGEAEPTCPPGTSPGVLNGCYSGYCILDFQCT